VFKPGVTAIVGPNGCGKSNVVDAIRWVLGETNARSLRGEILDDVIFSGSEDRKPLGMAEVGITIVNDDMFLPIEYSEVNIKRRLYRSGESEYLINKNNVRLRDIQELFTDTGIGKAAYSIMEQGKIDMILSNKPEERIAIFEEAAGISRYKLRMKQSYSKLASTEENLIRVNLIINEVEKEYRSLEKQAEKALLYKRIKQEEIECEILYQKEKLRLLKEQILKNEGTLKELKNKKNSCLKEFEKLDHSVKHNFEKVKKLEAEIVEIKNGIYKIEAEIEATNSKRTHIQERVYEIKNEIAKKNHLIDVMLRSKGDIEGKVKKLGADLTNINDLVSSQEEKLKNYLGELKYVGGTIHEGTEKISKNSKALDEIGGVIRGLRDELGGLIDKLLKEIDTIKSKFKGTEKRKNELRKNVSDSFSNIDKALQHFETKLSDLVYSIDESMAESFIGDLVNEIIGIRDKVSALKNDVETVVKMQDDLSMLLFGKESLHTQKEKMEHRIEKSLIREKDLKDQIALLTDELNRNVQKKDELNDIISNLRPDIAMNREKAKHLDENMKRLKQELERNDDSIEDVKFEVHALGERVLQFEEEINKLDQRSRDQEKNKLVLGEKTKKHNSLIDRILSDIQRCESAADRKKKQIEDFNRLVEKVELSNAELSTKIETTIEHFKDRYSIVLDTASFSADSKPLALSGGLSERKSEVKTRKLELKTINDRREKIRQEIASIGQVNLIAIEEFNEVKKRYEYLKSQKEDLEKAREDINVVVSKTLKASKELFMSSFEKINQNFNGIFRRLFSGGRTDLFLTEEANIFESGVDVMACPPGKTLKRRTLLSGGEKSLTAIALLFAVFMVKPSPFCMLDEVDHDLDEENIVRFLKLLKEFTDTTQFIIITHNRRTIEFADVIYGITAEEAGVSKVVSLDLVEEAIE
jgi:chromosome segregation protein